MVGGDGFLPGQHEIDAYGDGGFRFGEMSHKGSILALPSGVSALNGASVDANAAYVLEQLRLLPRGEVEILLIGTGADFQPLEPAFGFQLAELGITFENMATGSAARIYNVLLAERRRVAAMLTAVG